MITFTEKAVIKIMSIMNEQKVSDDTRVRVGVKGGGCSGFTYTVDFVSRKGKFDTEIDWSNDLNDRGLKFNNPSAKGSCGCRTSFMYDNAEHANVKEPSWM